MSIIKQLPVSPVISAVFCGQLRTAEIKIQNTFSNSNSNSAVNVKYLISPNYYTRLKKNWYYINVYTTIKGYLAVA